MTVSDQIERIKTNIANAYATAETMGATIPELQNSENLSDTISTITGGGSSGENLPLGIIYDEVNTQGYPTKVIMNLEGYTVNTPLNGPRLIGTHLNTITHLHLKGGFRTINSQTIQQQYVLKNLRLLIIPAETTTIDLTWTNLQADSVYIIFEGTTPPTLSGDPSANNSNIYAIPPDDADYDTWSAFTANNGWFFDYMYSEFVSNVCNDEAPWDYTFE